MTVSITTTKNVCNGNGLTREWDYTFYFNENWDDDYIKVYLTNTDDETYLIDANYSIDKINKKVIYPTISSGLPLLPNGWKITIIRQTPQTQTTTYGNQSNFPTEAIEENEDKAVMMIQEQQEVLNRCLKLDVSKNTGGDDIGAYLDKMAQMEFDTLNLKNETSQLESATQTLKDQASQIKTDTQNLKDQTNQLKIDTQTLKDNFEVRGMPFWSSSLTYQLNSMCQVDGKVYVSQVNGNINHNPATDDGTYWKAKIITNDFYLTGNSLTENTNNPAIHILYRNKNAVDNEIASQIIFRTKDVSGNVFDGNRIQAKHYEPSYKGQSLEFWNQYNGTWYKAFETWSDAIRIKMISQPAIISASASSGTYDFSMPNNFYGFIYAYGNWGGNCGHWSRLYWCSSDYDVSSLSSITSAGNSDRFSLSLIDGWGPFTLRLTITNTVSVGVFLLPFGNAPALPDNL